MEYTYLGRTGLKVARLCLGTMNFGPKTDEADAFAIMDAAVDAGVTFFDTANVYGGYGGNGHRGWTEEIIGRWFALGGGRREKVILATKVYGEMSIPPADANDDVGLSAYKIRRHVEGSLQRLQTDHIELYQMHHVDEKVGWDELYGVFEDLVSAGKIVYVGGSNFGARHLCYAQAEAAKRGFLGLVSEQHKYALTCRLPELELIPACIDLGVGVIAWSPLAGGLLSGHAQAGDKTRSASAWEEASPERRDQVQRFEKHCSDLGEKPGVVALAWVLAQPGLTAPIIGPRTMEQLDDAVHATEISLSDETLSVLDEIFSGPGGAAPAAYAW